MKIETASRIQITQTGQLNLDLQGYLIQSIQKIHLVNVNMQHCILSLDWDGLGGT